MCVWFCLGVFKAAVMCADPHNYPSLNDIVGGVGKGRNEEW